MPITKYENQVIENKVLVLEEVWLVNVVLRNCTLFYSGGACHAEGVKAENNCVWKLAGPAAATLQVLQMAGLVVTSVPQQMGLPLGTLAN